VTDTQPEVSLPALGGALDRAQAWLGPDFAVDRESPMPNPFQGLWIVAYTGPHGEPLDGAVLAVTADEVRGMDSSPMAEELVGAQYPPDDEEYDDEPVTASAGQFGPPGEDFDDTVCIMAVPAADDPIHDIGPEDKHATLLYFGDRSASADPERIEDSKSIFLSALRIAAEETPPFTARVTGVEPLGDNDPPAQVWLLDSPDLQRLFDEIPDIDSEIASMYGDADATRYPEYKPHVTIGYGGPEVGTDEATEAGLVSDDNLDEARQVKEIRFDRISLWWGNEHTDFALGTSEFDALLALHDEDSEVAGLLEHLGFDPNQKRAADGEWDPDGSDGKGKPKHKESEWQKVEAVVKGLLAVMDDLLKTLSGPQAHALIKKIKENAKAFVEGQAGHDTGGGPKGGAKKGGGGPKGGAKKGGADGPGGGGGHRKPGLDKALINSVRGLLKGFGNQMKPTQRAKLEKAVKDLGG
jgi:2'-5' RNA ligase